MIISKNKTKQKKFTQKIISISMYEIYLCRKKNEIALQTLLLYHNNLQLKNKRKFLLILLLFTQ